MKKSAPEYAFSWSGEFSLREQENAFMQAYWAERYQQLRAALGVGGLIFFLFGYVDLVKIQPESISWVAVAARSVVLVAVIVFILPNRSASYKSSYDLIALALLIAASTVVLSTIPFYGEGIIFHIISMFVFVIAFYLFVPIRLRYTILPATFTSVGFLLTVYLSMNPGTHTDLDHPYGAVAATNDLRVLYREDALGQQKFWIEFGSAMLFLMVGNVLGPITVRRLNRLHRIQYVQQQELTAEMAVRKMVEADLAAARDNLEVEVQDRLSDLEEAKKQLEWQANFDPLTSLPNRWLMQDRLAQAIARSQRDGSGGAVLFIGLDRMKQVNDSLGHGAGDDLLLEAARRLSEVLRSEDTVARFSGDEFVVVIERVASSHEVEPVIKKIEQAFAKSIVVDGTELFVSVSVGVSHFPTDGSIVAELLSNADVAMYKAKEDGGSAYSFFSREMNQAAVSSMEMEFELRGALDRDELQLFYQPLVDTDTGLIRGAEALLRWTNERLGFVSPVDFISLAERRGLIDSIGAWVLEKACSDAVKWSTANGSAPFVAVNVSARQLQAGQFPVLLESVLDKTGLDPTKLELELTESFLASDPDFALKQLRRISESGVKLSIDDFGTGYSALSSLRQFPFSTLKIDRSFIPTQKGDSEEARLVTAIISMAKIFQLEIIAEGVETAEQWAFLRERNCDILQGFHMSRPVPLAEFEPLLHRARFDPPPMHSHAVELVKNIPGLRPNLS